MFESIARIERGLLYRVVVGAVPYPMMLCPGNFPLGKWPISHEKLKNGNGNGDGFFGK